jgi:hypothetical protein
MCAACWTNVFEDVSFADAGYRGPKIAAGGWQKALPLDVAIIKRPDIAISFKIALNRWVVEGQSRDSLAAEDQPSIGKISIAPRSPFCTLV